MEANSFSKIQGVLSIGYVYLIVLGIIKETLYYNQMGVNYLNYSGILDVLISPLAKLTSSNLVLFVFAIVSFLIFSLPNFLAKKKDTNWFKKAFKFQADNLTESEVKSSISNLFLFMFAIGLFGFFIGVGTGGGDKIKDKIESGTLDYNDKLKFNNGDVLNVAIVGINSTYVFYFEKDIKVVQISPISGMVKSIEEVK